MKLSNRTVLVTGGTSGIGLGIAEAFHRSSNRVIVCGRDRGRLSAVERRLPEITALSCDVEDDADMIFYGDGEQIMSEPRGQSESHLLTPTW